MAVKIAGFNRNCEFERAAMLGVAIGGRHNWGEDGSNDDQSAPQATTRAA
ncbi:MAG: hypothetical protein JO122_12370 [Acetobacteraceae bacterium]|nr:hypothetical protein [Acetobacteraceae bacterium]